MTQAATDREWVAQDERIKKLAAENERLSRLLGLVEAYQAAVSKPPRWMSTPSKGRANALACFQFSDWHHFKKVHVEAVVGNHGRLTKKMPAKNRGRNSWDWLLYQMVKGYFASDARVTWNIAEGSYLFTPIYGRHAFLTHGDEANGGGGWAGIWSPLGTIHRRAIELGVAHEIRPAYSVIGHWHQTILAHQRGISCNGSGKGWDEYAASRRFAPEAAMQNFWAESPAHGTIFQSALHLTDRRREGW